MEFQLSKEDIILITLSVSLTIIILLIFFFLIVFRYFNSNRRKQKEIFESVLSAQENERQRIAHDLHDQIAPMLSAIKLNMGMFNREKDPVLISSAVKETQNNLDVSITDIRRISHNLVPKKIAEQGLAGSIEEYIRYLQKSESIGIDFKQNILGIVFGQTVETNLYRIVQELINNAIRHGSASQLNLEMMLNGNELNIYISDNGKGFNMETKQEGIGTKSIESRVALYNGRCEWISKAGEGTKFKAVFNTGDLRK